MMKMLSIGNFGKSWDGSICDEEHIANAFEAEHWEVGRFQREETILDDWPTFAPDFILVAQWYGYPENFVARLKEIYKAPVIYWAFDYQWDSQEEWHFTLAKESDLFLSKELDHKADYEEIGCKFQWFSQDFAPEFLDKYDGDVEKKYEVLFTGSYLPQATFRNELLKAVDEKFDLHVYTVTPNEFKSLGLKNVYPGVVDHALPALYASAKINLSVDWKQADGYWSDRMAQIMCCGGLVLNKYVPMQENIFHTYPVYFTTIKQCLTMIQFLLQSELDRADISKCCYEFAQEHLKVTKKVRDLLLILAGRGCLK